MMTTPKFENLFILRSMRQQGLRGPDLEGEIISGSMNNKHVSFKSFNILF